MSQVLDDQIETNLTIGNALLEQWENTRKWTLFLSVLGLLFVGLLFVIGLYFMIFGGIEARNYFELNLGTLSLIYIVLGAIYGLPIYFLFKYSTEMRKGIKLKSQILITEAFSYLRRHYKTFGIMIMVMISFYVLLFLVGITTALSYA